MADAQTPTSPYEWIGRISAPSLLAIALGTYMSGLWVSAGELHRLQDAANAQVADAKADRDQWKQLALKGATVATEATNHTIQGVRKPEAPPAPNSDKDSIHKFLDRLSAKVKNTTEPTDKPLP
jgi:hypothetical protein